MYIRKVKFNGVKGVYNEISIDMTPTSTKKYMDNVVTWNLDRNVSEFSALRQIALVGMNAAGKTSILAGIATGLNFIVNPEIRWNELRGHENIFNESLISFDYEIVMKKNGENGDIVGKYNLSFSVDTKNRRIISECLIYTGATATVMRPPKIIYKIENKKLQIGDNIVANDFDLQLVSFISLLKPGNALMTLTNMFSRNTDLKEHNDFFRSLGVFSEGLGNMADSALNNRITYPIDERNALTAARLIKLIDPNVKEIHKQPGGIFLVFENYDGNTMTMELYRYIEVLSAGTYKTLNSFSKLFRLLNTNDIVVWDEWGISMHDGVFKVIFELIRKKSTGQLIFATHSPQVFNQNIRLDQILNVTKSKEGVVVKKLSSEEYGFENRSANANIITRELQNSPDPLLAMELIFGEN